MTDFLAQKTPQPVSKPGEIEDLELRKVWDFPTRIFHWLLVASVLVGYYLGDNLSFNNYNWHFRLGYVTGALVLFRIFWGFWGWPSSRFKNFFPTPGKIIHYLREHMFSRDPSGTAGHNPLGAASVFALLGILSIQVITGLMAYSDDYFAGGPVQPYVSESLSLTMTAWHHYATEALFILVLVHFAAISYYWVWKNENLVGAMINGWKWVRRSDIDREEK